MALHRRTTNISMNCNQVPHDASIDQPEVRTTLTCLGLIFAVVSSSWNRLSAFVAVGKFDNRLSMKIQILTSNVAMDFQSDREKFHAPVFHAKRERKNKGKIVVL
jgi:hypothetical protein